MEELLGKRQAPAPVAALSTLAKRLGRKLPTQLRELLRRSNGGAFASDVVLRVPDGSTAASIDILSAGKIAALTRTLLGFRPQVVWAEDGNGNALVVDGRNRVSFWDHDTDELVPFETTLGQMGRHFFRRTEEPRAPLKLPGAPLARLLDGGASLEKIEAFLRKALTEKKRLPYAIVAVRGGRRDVLDRIHAISPPTAQDLVEELVHAAEIGSLELLQHLVRLGAPIDGRSTRAGSTALMGAARGGHRDAAVWLLHRGADPTLRTIPQGLAAVHIARIKKHPAVAELLAARGGLGPAPIGAPAATPRRRRARR